MFSQGRIRVVALWLADMGCIAASWTVSILGYWLLGRALDLAGVQSPIGGYSPQEYIVFWPVMLLFVAINAIFDTYHGNWMYPSAPLPPVEEMRRLFGASMLTHIGVLAYLALAYQTTVGISRAVITISGVLAAFSCQSFRNWARALMAKTGAGQIDVFLAGDGEAAKAVAAALAGDSHSGFRITGRFTARKPKTEAPEFAGIPVLGRYRHIVREAKKRDVKTLLVCMDARLFGAMAQEFTRWFVHIEYLPTADAFPVFGARAVAFGGVGGFEMQNFARMRAKRFQKRLVDAVLAVFAAIALLPAFIVLPLLIKLTSKGPVFYRQTRLGRYGKPFRIWKFRSMYADADKRLEKLLAENPAAAAEWESERKLRNDPRITPFGRFLRKTSLDETPQLFNVFAGEMSLIGPRPIVAAEKRHYGGKYAAVSSVLPGITGLWQVSGRSDADYPQRVALDSYYVLNWSPWMDFWVLARTVFAVVLMRGAR